MAKKRPAARRAPARERLLAAAEDLFYGEGINTVGIDRVIEHAGVAKAWRYDCFGSKEGLIQACLPVRHQARQKTLRDRIALFESPRDGLLSVFDVLAELGPATSFRGCAFIRAHAEAHAEETVKAVCDRARAWMRDLFMELARNAGAPDSESLAAQLVLLYDGTAVAAQMDRDPTASKSARKAVALMLDTAVGRSRSVQKSAPRRR